MGLYIFLEAKAKNKQTNKQLTGKKKTLELCAFCHFCLRSLWICPFLCPDSKFVLALLFAWVPRIQTQVPMLVEQALTALNHLPRTPLMPLSFVEASQRPAQVQLLGISALPLGNSES